MRLLALLLASFSLAVVGCDGGGPVAAGGSARCGDGTVTSGEACDDGAANSDDLPNACRTTCVFPRCGDRVVDRHEGCDEGEANGDGPPARCGTDCRPLGCGNGFLDPGEECDRGEANDDDAADACRTTCRLPTCGDAVVDSGETCDSGEGNGSLPDACRPDCTPPRCGDGVIDTGESCDDGPENGDPPATCRGTCVLATCGDGLVDAGEACDDGDANSDTTPGACRTACVRARCGDAVIDPGETCDAGSGNSDTAPDACRLACVPADCGDGVVDTGESCDAGAENSDTTPNTCRLGCGFAGCGDGVVDSGEACDDGPFNDDLRPGACRTTCTDPFCGDGVVDPGEECDFGATGAVPACQSCGWQVPSTCNTLGLAVLDLRAVGTPIARGWQVDHEPGYPGQPDLSPGSAPSLRTACGGAGGDTLFAFVAPAAGDLVVEVETPDAATTTMRPIVELRVSCAEAVSCQAAPPAGPGRARLVVHDVAPGVHLLHVDWAQGSAPFRLRAELYPPLAADAPCGLDGETGRCLGHEPLACVEPAPDGDGLGLCVEAVPAGGACGDTAPCATGAECIVGAAASGTCVATCGNGRLDPREECDDGNALGGDTCSSSCRAAGHSCADAFDLATRWDPAQNRATLELPGSVFPPESTTTCSPREDLGDALVRFTPPTSGSYTFVLTPSVEGALEVRFDCPAASHLLGCGSGPSTRLPSTARISLFGNSPVWIHANLLGPAQLAVHQGSCGDGRVDPGETCDDGNLADGDACSATCQQGGETCAGAVPLPVDANGSAVWRDNTARFAADETVGCSAQGPDAVAVFQAPVTGTYEVARRDLGYPTALAVRSACGSVPTCVGADVAEASVLRTLAAGEPWFLVAKAGAAPGGPFEVTVRPVRCGDGRRSTGEACDDGNLAAGDGCDATCQPELVELEPNDGPPQANPLPLGTTLRGELEFDRSDGFAFHAVATGRYTIELNRTDSTGCSRPVDVTLDLFDAASHLVASTFADPSPCPRIAWRAASTGEYRLVIWDRGNGPGSKAYTLRVTSP